VGAELLAIDDDGERVRTTVRHATGALRTVEARYMVAADGAHSAVRRMLGVEVQEREGSLGGVQVVFRAPLWDLLRDLRYALYVVTDPDAPGLFLPAGPTDRWVYGPGMPADDERSPGVDTDRLVEQIRRGAGVDLDPRIERIGPFLSPGEIAARFRVGRTFLVGDAAHRVTPRGGTGMNIALQSGHDIAWKLAWVLQGWTSPRLLESYEAERRVVAEHNLVRSTDPDGSRRPVVDELHVDLGGRVAHAWLPSSQGRVSTLDLIGPGWTLFTGPAAGPRAPFPLPSRAPMAVRGLDPLTARAVGVRGTGALLVRPDGVAVASWPWMPDPSDLRRAVASSADRAAPDLVDA